MTGGVNGNMVSQDSNARNGGLWQLEQTEPKPPLPGKVARRSRDGEVGGRCYAMIPGFLPGLEAPPSEATPQALRASSPSRGAKKIVPSQFHPQGDGDSHAAEAAVRCSPSRAMSKT